MKLGVCALPTCSNTFPLFDSGRSRKYCSRKHMHRAASNKWWKLHQNDPEFKTASRKSSKRWADANPEYIKEKNASRDKEKAVEYGRSRYQKRSHDELTYLMYSPGLKSHKIGFTKCLPNRLVMLRCGCWDIELLDSYPYGRKLEKWLHNYFDNDRIEGTEWFRNLTQTMVNEAVALYEKEVI